jgi:hypothetical protein
MTRNNLLSRRSDAVMDFICYLHPGWQPLIRPAEATRKWMDETPEAFAYRCLPLDIANAHGWEILSPCDATAYWTGGAGVEDVVVRTSGTDGPVSLFGNGVLTFHVQALFRTPPGWDLWISGSPNRPKPGITSLTGIVETDWSPYTFTMNWKFTRRNHRVSFSKHEPICFVFPIERGALERMEPKFVTLTDDSDLVEEFHAWSRSRNAFQVEMADGRQRAPSEKWQKRYYRGVSMRSDEPTPGHRTKMRLKPFVHAAPAAPSIDDEPDEAWLTGLLAGMARALRGGHDGEAVVRSLITAGIPDAMAARLAAAVARAVDADHDGSTT